MPGLVPSKLCSFHSAFKKKKLKEGPPANEEPPQDCCVRNHVGSSGSVEPAACVEMAKTSDRKCNVDTGFICMDDDASTRSALSWNNADCLINNNATELPPVKIARGPNKGKDQPWPDKGRLPGDMPEPTCVADPNHRKKLVTGDLLKLAASKKAVNLTMTKMDKT